MQIQVCNPGTWFGRVTGIFVAFWSFLELVRLQSGRASSTKPAASLYNPARSTVSGSIWLHLAPSLHVTPLLGSSSGSIWVHDAQMRRRSWPCPSLPCFSLLGFALLALLALLAPLTLSPQPYPSSSMLLLPPPSPGISRIVDPAYTLRGQTAAVPLAAAKVSGVWTPIFEIGVGTAEPRLVLWLD